MVNYHKVALEEQREPQTEEQPSANSGEQEMHEKRTKSFHEACRARTHEYRQQAETRETCVVQRR